jgi:hypothetical protein
MELFPPALKDPLDCAPRHRSGIIKEKMFRLDKVLAFPCPPRVLSSFGDLEFLEELGDFL